MTYSAVQLARKLDISRSYLYYLKDNGAVNVAVNADGRTIWDEKIYQELSKYIKKNKVDIIINDEKKYKTIKINNRRLTYPHAVRH